ncbi:MAG: 2-oxo acid dehydrogenase subunit E2 [Acidimicrobiales bacterium]|nr:2-oxo acid dehydrogenase subunit E2 [Acidimicrobiales bacterium]
MGEFRMPSLGADMESGTLLEWRVQPGDAVHKGDIVAVVDTDKSAIEVEIFESGVIGELLVPVGDKVPVGTLLATVLPPGATLATPPAAPPAAPAPAEVPAPRAAPAEVPAPPAAAVARAAAPHASHLVSPVVRHLAERLGVDLDSVAPTGAGGRITRADVERAAPEVAAPPPAPAPAPAPAPEPSPAVAAAPAPGRPRSSPYARRLAAERGVDLADVAGSGPDGAVVAGDVTAAPSAAAPAPAPAAPAPAAPAARTGADRQASMRRAIAASMERSKREIPHYYVGLDIELGAATAWLDAANAERPVAERLLPAVLLLKAAALAARALPELNGFWVDGGFRPADHVHLGVAVSLRGGGLVAPAIHDADTLGLDELMAALRDLVGRARAGRLRSSEMADPTITVTNLGDQGVTTVYAVITPPQVAMVGFGRVAERPWAEGGMVGPRPVVTATLAADHRVTDGLRGARFLTTIDKLLHAPEDL